MDFKKLQKDLDMLNKPMIDGIYNLCYSDGYYAKSLEHKYCKSIGELEALLYKHKQKKIEPVDGALFDI